MRVYRYAPRARGSAALIAVAVDGKRPVGLLEAWWEAAAGRPGEAEPWLTSTLRLIEEGPSLWQSVAQAARESTAEPVDQDGDVRWLCPLDGAASLRDFLAFEDHVRLGAQRRNVAVPPYWYEAPVYYKGNHRSLMGPDEPCAWPAGTDFLDFELELAMIIGASGRDIPPEEAPGHIFGFTVFNDFSARDVQAKEMSAWLGPAKGKDFANALGPCIVTVDELGAAPDLAMACSVNGVEWGRARSSAMHWRWADMIAHVSSGEDIWPGDVYGSGTPGGCCGLDLGRRLEPGDIVELAVERIGVLRNRISAPPPK